jgi:hypothetical protein
MATADPTQIKAGTPGIGNPLQAVNSAEQVQQELVDEMRLQDFDSIRFATYRTACKLRFVQTKTNSKIEHLGP